jgi:hypothetical protein
LQAAPIFSQHSFGDKHKFERFFQPGTLTIASVLAPIHYGPVPSLIFKRDVRSRILFDRRPVCLLGGEGEGAQFYVVLSVLSGV